MKLKQIISAALITALLPLSVGTAAFGAEGEKSVFPGFSISKAEVIKSGDRTIIDDGNNDDVLLETAYPKLRSAAAESYNSDPDSLKYITPVKDQGTLGTCWSFASTSCVETQLMRQDGSTDASDSKYDFSELHAVLACCNSFLLEGKYGLVNSDYNDGGLERIYGMYTTRAEGTNLFNGPVSETDMAYTEEADEIEAKTGDDMGSAKSIGYFPGSFMALTFSADLTEAQISSRNTLIKDLINAYGIVSTALYRGAVVNESYANYKQTEEYTVFYETDYEIPNHSVAIVGYDDSFDKGIFKEAGFEEPNIDGAFLVKNSWGDDWGKNSGYFYMSYASCITEIYGFGDLISRDIYDYEYDYTPFYPSGGVSVTDYEDEDGNIVASDGIFANNFEKQSEKPEELTAVSVYVYSADTDINIYVDTDDSDGMNNDMQLLSFKEPDDNSIAYSLSDEGTSINAAYEGNYVFVLEEPVPLEGDFTIAVDAVSSNGYPIGYETSMYYSDGSAYLKHKFIDKTYLSDTLDGEYYNFKEAFFGDSEDAPEIYTNCNLMIRAYTSETPVYVTIDGTVYEAEYGAVLGDVLSDAGINETVYEEVSGEENSYSPVDTDTELTKHISLYTGSSLSAPSIATNSYQTSDDGYIRFVGEIKDEFDTAVERVIALGFVYSADGGDTTETIVCGNELYEALGDYTAPDNTYLFKSGELNAADYIVSAYVSYVISGETDTITVYTEKNTISTSSDS